MIMSHGCYFTDIGDVYCWGWNESGQLGLPCEAVTRGSKTNAQQTDSTSDVKDTRSDQPSTSSTEESKRSRDRETINIQTIPCLVDFETEDVDCHRVSCGSRHTAALTGTLQFIPVFICRICCLGYFPSHTGEVFRALF